MPEVIINCVPEEAELDVEPYVPQLDFITTFRRDCFDGDELICEWEYFKSWLESGTIAEFWWEFTRNERYSMAVSAIKNTKTFYNLRRSGLEDCQGGEGEHTSACCVSNVIMSRLVFGEKFNSPQGTNCYKKAGNQAELCYYVKKPYQLPFYGVGCVSDDGSHNMCSILIGNEFTDLNSWLVFQYDDVDIKFGDSQMPIESIVKITIMHSLACGHYSTTLVGGPFNV